MIPALLLVLLAVVYRIATAIIVQGGGSAWLSNFAPLAAIALCSAIYFPRKYKFTVPFAALLISDIVLDVYYGASLFEPLILCRYFAFALVGLLGLAISRRASLRTIIPASLAGSALFYGITNAFSWLTDPGVCEKFRRLYPGADGWSAAIWIYADLDVLSQLARERLAVHTSFCRLHELQPARRAVRRFSRPPAA